jgi:hypothetical protein
MTDSATTPRDSRALDVAALFTGALTVVAAQGLSISGRHSAAFGVVVLGTVLGSTIGFVRIYSG